MLLYLQFYISVGFDSSHLAMLKFNRKSYTRLCHTRKQIPYITENTSGIPLDENGRRIFGIQGGNSQIFRAIYITDLAVIYSVGEKG